MEKQIEKEIILNGYKYILESEVAKTQSMAEVIDGMKYCIVRTYSAGVFAGYVKERNGKEVTIVNVRRIWYWDGANSLSQLAVDGTLKPNNCKFAVVVPEIIVTEAIEIIPCTENAMKSIMEVPEWKLRK